MRISFELPRDVSGIARFYCLALLASMTSACVADGDHPHDASTSSFDSASLEPEGGEDEDASAIDPEAAIDQDSAADAAFGEDDDAGIDARVACLGDEDCDDGVACNGAERCLAVEGSEHSACVAGTPPECTVEHPCRELTQGCDCMVKDADGDKVNAEICGGDDCDDSNIDIYKGATEVCDAQNRDEDCNPATVSAPLQDGKLDGDKDRDGYVAVECANFDRKLKRRYTGDDCDDSRNDVHPRNSEVCNYIDDNCDGLVDEFKNPETGTVTEFGLRPKFYPDFDQDHFADMNAVPKMECDFRIPVGYVFKTQNDCDDRPQYGARTHPGAPELCDQVDNDCDDKVDEIDDMKQPFDFEATTLMCSQGRWTITSCPERKLWCGTDPAEGCRTDGTRLSTCGSCQTSCKFSCGLRDCDEVRSLATGEFHACALTRAGRVACWGRGSLGRLGTDSTASSSVPTTVAGPLPVVEAIAAGGNQTCAIAGASKALFCWGSNSSGQLGTDAVAVGAFTATFVQVGAGATSLVTGILGASLTNVADVDLAAEHTCAVLGSGHLTCWGEQADGRLGNNRIEPGQQSLPVTARRSGSFVGDARVVALGDKHGCIITTSGTVDCWGDNTFGQLGRPPAELTRSPLLSPVPGLKDVIALDAGAYHTCALTGTSVVCWGENKRYQLGRVTDADFDAMPGPVMELPPVRGLDVGRAHSCALGVDNRVLCWGADDRGQLGDDGLSDIPIPVMGTLQATQLAAGGEFTCALASEGAQAYCWGDNYYGQQGSGQTDSAPRPVLGPIRALAGSLP